MERKRQETADWQTNKRRQTKKLATWTGAWLLTMAIAVFGPAIAWASNPWITVGATAVNLLVGAGMIVANRDLLRSLDEMERQIHLDAMAITLGIGLIVGLAYSNLDVTNVLGFDAEISHLVMLMGMTYLAAVLRLNWQYR